MKEFVMDASHPEVYTKVPRQVYDRYWQARKRLQDFWTGLLVLDLCSDLFHAAFTSSCLLHMFSVASIRSTVNECTFKCQ